MLIDTNILIYSLNKQSPKMERAQKFLQQHIKTAIVAHQNILEAYRVLTRSTFSHKMTSIQANKALSEISNSINIIHPNGLSYAIFMNFIKKYNLKRALVIKSRAEEAGRRC